ncbi:hypothetical protein RclHR1_14220004 [Rhizophagus clarus]|nr:hypothetical protein RclHR1_14220004 [Rhizophagus clarus]
MVILQHFAETDDPKGIDSSESSSSELKEARKNCRLDRNYVEDQTNIEPGKELTDSSEESDSDYTTPEKKKQG